MIAWWFEPATRSLAAEHRLPTAFARPLPEGRGTDRPRVDLDDTTPFAAQLFRGEPEPRVMLATLVVKVAYEVPPEGPMRVLPAEEAPIYEDAEPMPLGLMPSDKVPYRKGVDVFVHGRAYAPKGVATKAMIVGLRLGGFVHEMLVVGDRTWQSDAVIAGPEPFETMPLTYERAYGGLTTHREAQVAFPDNPEGRGFICERAHVEGTPLPNIEDPARRIDTWQDQPPPRGWAPLSPQTAIHLHRSIQVLDAEKYTYRFTPQVFSCAHPDLVQPELPGGTPGVLHGVTPSGVFAFEVPHLDLRLGVELGPKRFELRPRLDTLGLFPEQGRVVASFRTSFRYRLEPEQVRVARLSLAP